LPLFAGMILEFLRRKQAGRPFQFRPRWIWMYLAAFIIFGIVRDLPVPMFAAFAP